MELNELLAVFGKGEVIDDPEVIITMRKYITENRKLLFEMNYKWHEDEDEITHIFSQIIGKPVDKSVRIMTPFYTDFGKNITVGKNIYINSDCKFQDQGGIYIGDGNFIHASSGTGYCVKISTLLSGSYKTRYETARRLI